MIASAPLLVIAALILLAVAAYGIWRAVKDRRNAGRSTRYQVPAEPGD